MKQRVNSKPRTYRKLARIEYLKVARAKRPSQNQKRKAIKKQLQYIKRNLFHIAKLVDNGAFLDSLKKKTI